MNKIVKTYTVYRDSKTGQFMPARIAKRRAATVKRETISVVANASPKSKQAIKFVSKKHDKALTALARR